MSDAVAYITRILDAEDARDAESLAEESRRRPEVHFNLLAWDGGPILVSGPIGGPTPDPRPTPEQRMRNAHRKIVELHFPALDRSHCMLCGWGEGDEPYYPCATIKTLAAGYGWTEA